MLFRMVIILLMLASASFGAIAQDFDAAIEKINRYRESSGDFRIVFTDDGFVVESTADGATDGKQPVFGPGSRGTPVLLIQQALQDRRLLLSKPDGIYGEGTQSAVRTFQHIVGLDEDGRVGKSTWQALELPVLASTTQPANAHAGPDAPSSHRFERSAWPLFLSELTQHGLVEYRLDATKEGPVALLSFKRTAKDQAWQEKPGISFTDSAWESLRLAEQFPPRPSRDGRFVVYVHEPHSDVAGHFQLIRGLDALISSNPNHKFRFLVEGEFGSESARDIQMRPTDAILSTEPGIRARQVQYLVRNFLIDSPLAYRLLYRDIPSRAIDHISVREGLSRDAFRALTNLEAVLKKNSRNPSLLAIRYEGRPQKVIKRGKYPELHIASIADQQATEFGRLLDAIREQAPGELPEIEKALVDAKQSLDAEAAVWRLAYKRSLFMAKEIDEHFQGADASLLPIAFIGSGHTATMLSRLSPETGYVVLEPRYMRQARDPRAEETRFHKALHNYQQGIHLAARTARKQRVEPPAWALPQLRDVVQRVEAKGEARSPIPPGPFDPEVVARLRLAMDRNPLLSQAEAQIADGSQPPNIPFSGAFARYSPDSGPHGRLTLLPGSSREWEAPAVEAWNGSDRFSFIERVLVSKDETRSSKRTVFSLDPVTKRPFAAMYVPEEKAYYFFDMSDKQAIATAYAQPLGAREQHNRFAEVLMRAFGDRPIS
jgi:hypothetical protein